MLYRCGPHRRRDTLRFCWPDNRGGYLHTGNDAYLIGHVWVEVGDEIADFSVGDWQAEADLITRTPLIPPIARWDRLNGGRRRPSSSGKAPDH